MLNSPQEWLADATQKAYDELVVAFLRLPEDKRDWKPCDKARSAIDQIAECAIRNGYSAELIQARQWPNVTSDDYSKQKAEALAGEWESLNALFQENTHKAISAIGTVPAEALLQEIELPWTTQALQEAMAFPYWNMTYHQGQINYIASMLGCLP